LNNEERDKLEQLSRENEEYKKKFNEIQVKLFCNLDFWNKIFDYLESLSVSRE